LPAFINRTQVCSKKGDATPTPTTNSNETVVNMKNNAFTSSSITIKAGATVKWVNQDFASHNVTSDGTPSFASSNTMTNGNTYSVTFSTAGTYAYHCGFHGSIMSGTVVVQ
jgi:plastocyanin